MKKVLSFILLLSLAISIFGSSFAYAEGETVYTSGIYKYKFIADKQIEITEYNGSEAKLIIPSEIDGTTVVGIGKEAFADDEYLVEVTIPDTVIYLDEMAFYFCSEVKTFNLSNNLEKIGRGAFAYCYTVQSINFPESLKEIGNLAFYDCTGMVTYTIPASVTKIGDFAFNLNTNLASITVNENNSEYCSEKGALYNKDKTTLICYPPKKTDPEFDVPDSVKTIENSAFQYAKNLVTVRLFEVETIGVEAFYDCTSLANIQIPFTLKSIGEDAFVNCKIKKLSVPETLIYMGEHAFGFEYNEKEMVYLPLGTVELIGKSGTVGYWYAKKIGLRFEETGVCNKGDINADGKVDIIDVALLRASIIGIYDMNDTARVRADVSRDNKADIIDAVILRSFIVNYM